MPSGLQAQGGGSRPLAPLGTAPALWLGQLAQEKALDLGSPHSACEPRLPEGIPLPLPVSFLLNHLQLEARRLRLGSVLGIRLPTLILWLGDPNSFLSQHPL